MIQFILYCCKNTVYTDKAFDCITLFVKDLIHICKMKDISLNLNHFKRELHSRRNIEKCIHLFEVLRASIFTMDAVLSF